MKRGASLRRGSTLRFMHRVRSVGEIVHGSGKCGGCRKKLTELEPGRSTTLRQRGKGDLRTLGRRIGGSASLDRRDTEKGIAGRFADIGIHIPERLGECGNGVLGQRAKPAKQFRCESPHAIIWIRRHRGDCGD